MAMQITSDTIIKNIDQHFKVSAGPGAGKTHWLINHLKNVLYHSNKLGRNKKIACITYTNNAVETILSRLGNCTDKVEVSTIHSFLYKNIAKPYIKFIPEEYELNVAKVDGHDDFEIGSNWIKSWIENHPNRSKLRNPFSLNQLILLPDNLRRLKRWLSSAYYYVNPSDEIVIRTDRSKAGIMDQNNKYLAINEKTLDLLEPYIFILKKEYWKIGLLSHDDVLFFSYCLIMKYPFILDILSSKYPYFFIDEFQDSNPIQTKILKMLEQKAIIGIIGDKAQSIYEFQGADVAQFDSFILPNMAMYEINDNRRSSSEIVKLLNHVRTDLKQNEENSLSTGFMPQIIVGDKLDAYYKAKQIANEDVYALSYSNIIANTMRHAITGISEFRNFIEDLKIADSNNERIKIIIGTINAIELAQQLKYKEAIMILEKLYPKSLDKGKKALFLLQSLLKEYSKYKDNTLFYYQTYIQKYINSPQVTRGKVKIFYETHTYLELASCVNIPENKSCFRTIHKAKGSGYENVMLVLEKESDIDFILAPNLMNNVDHRVYYVAMSRAKRRLFISVPTLSNKIEEKLNTLSLINIVHI